MEWWRNAVVYQVYPRSFADSDGDGVGDLTGILSRLDHLRGGPDSLGIDAIWLSPFYPSPMVDFGYDVADYTDVDPLFGDLATFDRLADEAHARGIRLIVDWVPNHTSDRHPWFLASRSSREDPQRDWYVWRDGAPGGGPPNGWRSSFARVGSAWTHDRASGQWYLHGFTPGQPDLRWANPAVEAAMLDTLRFWLDRGVDGFRIDVAHRLGLDPTVGPPAAPWDTGLDPPRGKELLRRVRAVLDEYEDRVAVGEVYVLDQRRLAPFLVGGDGLHLAHNFTFLRSPWSAPRLRSIVEELERLAPAPAAWPSWCLSNHDHSRTATRYDQDGQGPARARAAGLLVLALRGTTFLFQGEELGLPDARVPPEAVVDLDGRDPERAPIPWERPSVAGAGAGFTAGTPWLPVVEDAERLAVAAQQEDSRSSLVLFRRLISLRHEAPALREGGQRMLSGPREVLAWLREGAEERLLIAINMGPRAAVCNLSVAGAGGGLVLSTDPDRVEGPVEVGALALGRDEGVVVRLEPDA